MESEVRLLKTGDEIVLARVAHGVFDKAVNPALAAEFLADPRHHLAVAIDAGVVVGMASAVDYIHPDKPRELWINEIGVAATHRELGIAKRLLRTLLDRGREIGCWQAWVLTNRSNSPAMRLYGSSSGIIDESDTVMFTFTLDDCL